MGSVFGIVRVGQVIGFALGAQIAGVVYDSMGSYENAFFLCVVIAMTSSILILLARRPIEITLSSG